MSGEERQNQYRTMKLQAMVLDDQIAGRDAVRNWVFDYQNLDEFRSPEQEPLGNNINRKERGVWLRWILPESLRSEQEEGRFPTIPNRFLITRVSGKTGSVHSVVLETDCPLSENMDDETYDKILPYTTVYMIGEKDKEMLCTSTDPYRNKGYFRKMQGRDGYYVNLGVPFAAEDWEERDNGEPFLTACAPGNPDFTGYIRFHSNILAYFDDLSDCAEDCFHYSVIGWYSSGENSHCYYSGQVFSVKWRKEGYPISDDQDPYGDVLHQIRRTGKINVAMGENSQDAFRSWMLTKIIHGKAISEEEENVLQWVLAAFLSGDVGKFKGEDGGWQLKDQLQKDRFEAYYGGTEETKELDKEIEILHSLQEELQTVWWKKGYLDCYTKLATPDIMEILKRELDDQSSESLLTRVAQHSAKVRALCEKYKDRQDYEKARQQGRYWKGRNPYLLVSGVETPEDMDESEEKVRSGEDLCRDEAQEPKVKGTLPDGVTQLYQEAFFIISCVYPDESSHSNGPTKGTLPDYPMEPWHQPWKPAFMEWRICYEDLDAFQFDGFEYEPPSPGKEDPERQSGYTGRVALDAHKKQAFLEQLGYMDTLLSEQQLKEIRETVGQWKLLGQEMSGFMEQMGQRDCRAFIQPEDRMMSELLGYTSEDMTFFERTGSGVEGIPCIKNNVIPEYRFLRKGKGYLKDLILYDAFGRTLEVISSGEQQGIHSSDRFPVIGTRENHAFMMRPSLLQPCRLKTDLETAGETVFLGFVIPNYLTHSLLVYDSQGQELGELLVVVAEQKERRVYFQQKTAQVEDELILPFVDAMQEKTEEEFYLFLDAMESSFWTMEAAGNDRDQRRALLAGRPLAISKLHICLERYGLPKKDCGWKGGGETQYANQVFPVRIGNPSMREDGLTGYFQEGDFSVFYSTARPELENKFVKEIGREDVPYPMVGFQEENPQLLWIFYDPLLAVHIYTGILPVKRIRQDRETVLKILKEMTISLRVGPGAEREEDGNIVIREGTVVLKESENGGEENE